MARPALNVSTPERVAGVRDGEPSRRRAACARTALVPVSRTLLGEHAEELVAAEAVQRVAGADLLLQRGRRTFAAIASPA